SHSARSTNAANAMAHLAPPTGERGADAELAEPPVIGSPSSRAPPLDALPRSITTRSGLHAPTRPPKRPGRQWARVPVHVEAPLLVHRPGVRPLPHLLPSARRRID